MVGMLSLPFLALCAHLASTALAQTPTLKSVPFGVQSGSLESPWDIAFLPSGDYIYTEKCKGVSVTNVTSGDTVFLFGITGAVLSASDVFCEGQSGVLGVTVDPQFASNRYIYVFTASTLSTPPTNRVVRLALADNLQSVDDRVDIISDIPFKASATANGDAGAHSGGRVRFNPVDGFLYVTTGDNHSPTIPQNTTSLGAKVIRVDRNGDPAEGNDMPADADQRIYTFGHRNVQGIAFRAGSGQPFTAEHGPNHSDEVTALVAGGNAGWDPKDRPALECPDDYCGYAGDPESMPMTDTERFPNAMPPSWVWNGDQRGMGPAEFLEGPQWGDWSGRLVVGLMGAQTMYVLQLDEDGMAVAEEQVEGLPMGRYRALVMGPGGDLFVVVDDGTMLRVSPEGIASAAPQEMAPQGSAPEEVEESAGAGAEGEEGDIGEATAPAALASRAAVVRVAALLVAASTALCTAAFVSL